VRGKTTFLTLVAGLIMLCATAVAFAHEGELGVPGTQGSDELTLGGGNNRVYARAGDDMVDGGGGNDRLRGGRGDDTLLGGAGDDRLKGGQDDDYLDGGEGDDRINARGDGRDGDEVVCGPGEDTVLLGRTTRSWQLPTTPAST
jgi:Ca2+-binding RTX toxin-like protein